MIQQRFGIVKESFSPFVGPVDYIEEPHIIKLDLNTFGFDKEFIDSLSSYHSIDAFEELDNFAFDKLLISGIHKSLSSHIFLTVQGMDSFKDILKNSPKEYLFISPEFASVINDDIILNSFNEDNILFSSIGIWESKNIVIYPHSSKKCYLVSSKCLCDIKLNEEDASVNVYINKDIDGFMLEGIVL